MLDLIEIKNYKIKNKIMINYVIKWFKANAKKDKCRELCSKIKIFHQVKSFLKDYEYISF